MSNKAQRFGAHIFILGSQAIGAGAVAAQVMEPDLMGLPWMQIGLGGLLALWGGLTRTAERIAHESRGRRHRERLLAEPGAKVPPPVPQIDIRLELAKDVFVSSGVGFLIYVAGVHFAWERSLVGGALWIGGYLGTVALGSLGEKALDWIKLRATP